MSEEAVEVGRFGLGIRLLQHSDGRLELQTQSANENVPLEMVIMLLRAFLKNMERDYFNEFDKSMFKA